MLSYKKYTLIGSGLLVAILVALFFNYRATTSRQNHFDQQIKSGLDNREGFCSKKFSDGAACDDSRKPVSPLASLDLGDSSKRNIKKYETVNFRTDLPVPVEERTKKIPELNTHIVTGD